MIKKLKPVPSEKKKSLGKLPTGVRNKMGFLKGGGRVAAKNGLWANINARKKAGTSRSKADSTISSKSYKNMKAGFPNSKKNKAKA
mgnify:FL=1|tara:strand:- start:169 stop:426 length:258 start_codon:yes stop_codon:yes gene_type:complete